LTTPGQRCFSGACDVRIVVPQQVANNPGNTLTIFNYSTASGDLSQGIKGRNPNVVEVFGLNQSFESVDALF
jgi:hypothetical protein